VKFTEKGFVRISAQAVRSSEFGVQRKEKVAERITLNAELHADFVEISVEDTGIGIKGDDIPKLFNAFVRLESHLKSAVPGTGLGLYLTKKLLTDVLKGDILVESEEGKGCRFTMKIPIL